MTSAKISTVLSRIPLANGFHQITCTWPYPDCEPLPGHFVKINQSQRTALFHGTKNEITFLTAPTDHVPSSEKIMVSSLQGEALSLKPITNALLILEDHNLSVGFFYLKKMRNTFTGMVLLGTTTAFPFRPCPSRYMVPDLPAQLIAANPLLEDWGFVNRLASTQAQPGCYEGQVLDLAKHLQGRFATHLMLPSQDAASQVSDMREPCLT